MRRWLAAVAVVLMVTGCEEVETLAAEQETPGADGAELEAQDTQDAPEAPVSAPDQVKPDARPAPAPEAPVAPVSPAPEPAVTTPVPVVTPEPVVTPAPVVTPEALVDAPTFFSGRKIHLLSADKRINEIIVLTVLPGSVKEAWMLRTLRTGEQSGFANWLKAPWEAPSDLKTWELIGDTFGYARLTFDTVHRTIVGVTYGANSPEGPVTATFVD